MEALTGVMPAIFHIVTAGGAAPNPNLKVTLDKAFKRNGFSINRTIFDKYATLTGRNMTTPSTKVEAEYSWRKPYTFRIKKG